MRQRGAIQVVSPPSYRWVRPVGGKPAQQLLFIDPNNTHRGKKFRWGRIFSQDSLAASPFARGAHTMGGSMPRPDEPRAPVTEADVLAHLSRSRKPQSLREIAAALGLRRSARRALAKLARKMKKRGEIH